MRFLYSFAIGLLVLTVAAPALGQSQITTGVIDGIVVDASGAVLPGVDVEIRNVDTNLTRTLVTDRDGRFVALQLPPGPLHRDVQAGRLRDARAGERAGHRRRDGAADAGR